MGLAGDSAVTLLHYHQALVLVVAPIRHQAHCHATSCFIAFSRVLKRVNHFWYSKLHSERQTHLVIQQYRHRRHGNRQIKASFFFEVRVFEARRVLLIAGIEGQAGKTAKLAAIQMTSKVGSTATCTHWSCAFARR